MSRIRSFLVAGLVVLAPIRPDAAGPSASGEVTSISVVPTPGRAEVVVNIRGAVDVQDFVLNEPARLVVDVKNARLQRGGNLYDGVNRAGILNVRLGQYQPSVVRIVIELSEMKDYTVDQDGESIRISFGAERSFLTWSSAMPSEATPPSVRTVSRPEVVPPAEARVSSPGQEPRITVTWDNADIADVIAGFSAFSGRTIILGKEITGKVSAEIRNQPWPQAFAAILVAQGLSATEMPGGIIRVDSPRALAALDSVEPMRTVVVRVNYAQAAGLARSIAGILTKSRGSVVPDTATNSLIITDVASRIDEIERFTHGLDIRTPQVSIQAKIIFVDRTDLQQLGIKYDLGSGRQFFNKIVQRTDPTDGDPFESNVNVVDLGGNSVSGIANADAIITGSAIDLIFSTAIGGFNLSAFLSALQRVDLADVQAEPTISTLDNQKADILVGEETPIRVIDLSAQGSGNSVPRATVSFKETGIRLTVTPHVTNNRQILMDLATERSAVQPLAAADLGFNFTKQTANNRLLVNDGETAVIGGLTVTEVNRTKTGIPLLVDLPVIGKLFGFSSDQERRRDLIILVTPHIIDDGAPQ
ncbi:MAG: AMIN domain-containing protein [Gemmatimonadota bacterium]